MLLPVQSESGNPPFVNESGNWLAKIRLPVVDHIFTGLENANIEIENLQTGTTRLLAGVNDNYSGPQIGGFRFNPSGIHLGLEAILLGLLRNTFCG
jgi:hypothetical protein